MEFKPKDWVLVRNDEKEKWKLDIFSHFVDGNSFPYRCVGGYYDECIPYEGNEALLGKKGTPEEKHVWHVGDHVDVLSDFDGMWHSGFIIEIDYTRSDAGFSYRVESECFKSITGKAWCKADQLRKPEEKPEEEFKVGDKVEVQYCWDDKWYTGTIIEIDPDHTNFTGDEKYPYKVAASCFHDSFKSSRWCSRGQLREPVEKPESAKEWRPEKGEVVEALVNDEWQAATLILDDHTDFAPYRVRLQNGYRAWCTEEQVRPTQNEPFKFGDKVEIRKGVEWCEAVVIEIDHSDIPYKVATADGDIHWRRKEDVRRV